MNGTAGRSKHGLRLGTVLGMKSMNALLIFVVRLILGLVFGIILTRLFRPDWGIYHGVVTGIILTALAYGMSYLKKRNS